MKIKEKVVKKEKVVIKMTREELELLHTAMVEEISFSSHNSDTTRIIDFRMLLENFLHGN